MFRRTTAIAALALAAFLAPGDLASAQTPFNPSFTYQGRLDVGGQPADGTYNLRFRIFTAETGGTQVGTTTTATNKQITGGLFTHEINAASMNADGSARWLEIAIAQGMQDYTVLEPRQKLTATPYALGLVLPFKAEGSASTAPLMRLIQHGSNSGLYVTNAGSWGRAATFENNGSSATVAVRQDGAGEAIEATASGTGTTVTATATGYGRALSATAVGSVATFVSSNVGAQSEAVSIESNGSGQTLHVWAKGAGRALLARISSTQSTADAARFETMGQGSAVYALKNSASGGGAAITAHTVPAGVALNIAGGVVRCQGAGLNTNTWVFIHQFISANGETHRTFIDNPMTNGDPNAILIVTPRGQTLGFPNLPTQAVSVAYSSAHGKWMLQQTTDTPLSGHNSWNVMVIKR
jgi:hypothetical protein